jgi:signal transduction histidine kinase/PAS domain-containing protein
MSQQEPMEKLAASAQCIDAPADKPRASDSARSLRDLQVRQMELEMQNKQLIEDLHRVEGSLRNHVELYHKLPVAHFYIDGRGIIHQCNELAGKLLGSGRASLISKCFTNHLCGMSRLKFRSFLRQQADGQPSEPFLVKLDLRDDGHRFAEIIATLLPKKSKKYFHLAVFDVSKARAVAQKEKFLAESSERLFNILDEDQVLDAAIAMGVPILADMAFGFAHEQGGRLKHEAHHCDGLSLNRSAQLLLQDVSRDMSDQWLKTGDDADRKAVTVKIAGELRQVPSFMPATHLRLLSALRIASVTLAPLVARGRLWGAIVFFGASTQDPRPLVDASFLQLYCERVALAMDNAYLHEVLQNNVRVRDTILAVVSHDLRNPLSAILLKTERAMHTSAKRALDPGTLKAMESIHACGMRMHRLTTDLLDVSSVERNELSIEKADVEVGEIVDQAVDVVKEKGMAQGVSVVKRLHVDRQEHVVCDRQRILQVLGNLLDNAIKFSPGGGTVTLGICHPDKHHLLFEVEDCGQGFKKEDLDIMFDQFWQDKDNAHLGHGLGLYISRGIVQAHGGRIWAEDTGGHGARIVFTLPCNDDQERNFLAAQAR